MEWELAQGLRIFLEVLLAARFVVRPGEVNGERSQ
jgi:hypothetical protein